MNAVRMLESLEVSAVIHCGDIGSAEIPGLFAAWPTHYVLGNVDRNATELQQAIEKAGHTYHGRFGSVEWCDRQIAFLHSDDGVRFRETIYSDKWDLVCYGHTHRAEHHLEGKTLVLNPGAIYRANPHSIAIVELPDLTVTNVVV